MNPHDAACRLVIWSLRDFLRLPESIYWIWDNQTIKKRILNDGNRIQEYGILENVADDEKDFDYETNYSKNTKGLVKIRMQKILEYASIEGVAYKLQAKSKCYQTANFESNSAQI